MVGVVGVGVCGGCGGWGVCGGGGGGGCKLSHPLVYHWDQLIPFCCTKTYCVKSDCSPEYQAHKRTNECRCKMLNGPPW